MFKVNNEDTRTRWGVPIVNCEKISHIVYIVYIVGFEQVNADRDCYEFSIEQLTETFSPDLLARTVLYVLSINSITSPHDELFL